MLIAVGWPPIHFSIGYILILESWQATTGRTNLSYICFKFYPMSGPPYCSNTASKVPGITKGDIKAWRFEIGIWKVAYPDQTVRNAALNSLSSLRLRIDRSDIIRKEG